MVSLQHQDGHSHIMANTILTAVPRSNLRFRLAVIITDGLRRMYAEKENVFYYLLHERNYKHLKRRCRRDIIKGISGS